MIARELARRMRLAARGLWHPDSFSPPPPAAKTLLERLEENFREKLERLEAKITIEVIEPATKTQFRFVGPAADTTVFLRVVYAGGIWEAPVGKYIAENLGPGDVFIDIGANLGYFTALAAKRVTPGGRVHAFEASTFAQRFLRETIRANGLSPEEAVVHPVAAWYETATLPFRVSGGAPGGNHVVTKDQQSPNRTEEVQAYALSDYLRGQNLDALKLIKIDIEGAEIEALSGLKELLEVHPAEIVCEVNKSCLEKFGHSLPAFWDAVAALEFDVMLLNADGSLVPAASCEAFVEAYPAAEGQHLDTVLRPRSCG